MDRAPDESRLQDALAEEATLVDSTATTAETAQQAESADLSVAEQIRRQIRGETGEIKDPGLNLHLNMKGGGVELTDEAAQFKAERGEDFQPPPFQESEWRLPVMAEEGTESGPLMRWLVIGGLAVVLILAGIFYGLPAYREYSTRQAEADKTAELAAHPPLEAVTLDQAFYDSLEAALRAANSSLVGHNAYVYRYRVTETTTANVSQTLLVTLVLGGPGAAKLEADHAAYDKALEAWRATQTAHAGVDVSFGYENGLKSAAPLEGDHYIRYGQDFGREHMDEMQAIIDKLESKRSADGHYPRVLDSGTGEGAIRTNGGFGFLARGFGYLPVYTTDSRGNILMGTGSSTLEQLTPRKVQDYYLFYYLDEPGKGMDIYGPEAEDYYTRKIAPLPYDPGGPLHNVILKPDGRPDGVACVVKSGRVLKDGEL